VTKAPADEVPPDLRLRLPVEYDALVARCGSRAVLRDRRVGKGWHLLSPTELQAEVEVLPSPPVPMFRALEAFASMLATVVPSEVAAAPGGPLPVDGQLLTPGVASNATVVGTSDTNLLFLAADGSVWAWWNDGGEVERIAGALYELSP
jgi:hypothetical protein